MELSRKIYHIHTSSTSCDSSALLQAFKLALARVLGLALHEIIVVRTASGANEEGSRQQRRRGGANLLDLGDVLRQGGRIDQNLLVEAVAIMLARRFDKIED
jgi:hypothetical protein